MVFNSIFYGIGLPILGSVLILGVFVFLAMRQESSATADLSPDHTMAWGGALALGASYAIGQVGLLGVPRFPAIEASQWIFWFLPAALLLALLDSVWRIPKIALWLGRTVMLGGMLWMMFRSQVENEVWTTSKLAMYVAIMTAVSLILWGIWEQIAAQFSDARLGWMLMIFTITASLAMVLSNTAKLGQLFGVAVSSLGVWWVLSWFSQAKGAHSHFAKGILPVFMLIFVGLGFSGYFYADLNNLTAGLLVTSIVFLWVASKWIKPEKIWQQILLYTMAVVLPVGIGLAILIIKEMTKPKDSLYGMLSALGLG